MTPPPPTTPFPKRHWQIRKRGDGGRGLYGKPAHMQPASSPGQFGTSPKDRVKPSREDSFRVPGEPPLCELAEQWGPAVLQKVRDDRPHDILKVWRVPLFGEAIWTCFAAGRRSWSLEHDELPATGYSTKIKTLGPIHSATISS